MYAVPVSFKLWHVADTCMQTCILYISGSHGTKSLVKKFEKLNTVQMFCIYVLFSFGYLKFKANISGKYNIRKADS